MFSFSQSESLRSRVQIKMDNTDWSQSLSFDAVGSNTEFMMKTSDRENLAAYFGMSISTGTGKVSFFMPPYFKSLVSTF